MLRRITLVCTGKLWPSVLVLCLGITSLAGQQTGPISGEPPSASDETTAALVGASKNDPIGQHEGGEDGGTKDAGKKVKSEKERACPMRYQPISLSCSCVSADL